MNKLNWTIDFKSLFIGFCLALIVSFIIGGVRHSSAAGGYSIAADNDGLYIMSDNGAVRYIDKQKCRAGQGCYFGTQ